MSKRRHEDSKSPEHATTARMSLRLQKQQQELYRSVEHSKDALYKALKLARAFERQKLGRRQKTAQEKNDDEGLHRLRVEVVELKVRSMETRGPWSRTLTKL